MDAEGDAAGAVAVPDPYLAAERALGVRAAACVAVEDSPTGAASAEAAGGHALVVPLPIAPAPGRAVLSGLEQTDLPLPQALVAAPARI